MADLLILTSCINPPRQNFLKLTDFKERYLQTVDSIKFYIDTGVFENIVICDGSNYNLKNDKIVTYAKERNVNLEILCFKQNFSNVIKFGKGYGEGEIVEFITKHSQLYNNIKNFIKITGRLKILNIKDIISKLDENKDYFDFFPAIKIGCVDTRFYMIRKHVFETVLLNSYKKVNDDNRYSYEYSFTDDLHLNNVHPYRFPVAPIFSGYSGTTNTQYTKDCYYYLKRILINLGILNTKITAVSFSGLYIFNKIRNLLSKYVLR